MLSSNIAYRNAILHILALLHKISPTLDIWPEKGALVHVGVKYCIA
jgi:hypothetical protein